MKIKMQIKNQLILLLGIITTLVILLFAFLFYHQTKKILYGNVEKLISLKVNMVIQEITDIEGEDHEGENYNRDIDELVNITYGYSPEYPSDAVSHILIMDTKEQIIYQSRRLSGIDINPEDFPMPGNRLIYFTHRQPNTGKIRFAGISCIDKNRRHVFIYAGQSIKGVETNLEHIKFLLLLLIPPVILVIIVGSYMVIKKGFKPVSDIISNVEKIAGDNLGYRLKNPKTGDEIEKLTHTFNGLLERIENDVNRIKQFTSDASHELRTPLTVMKNSVQVSLKYDAEISEYREVLSSIEDELNSMERMLEELFILTRIDNADIKKLSTEIDILDFINILIFENYQSSNVNLSIPPGIKVYFNETLLGQVFKNLIVNAIKFCGEKVSITISAVEDDGNVLITFADDGPGVDEENLSKLFDRFYQVDTSRADRKGVGLGLSIVKSIIESHRGKIDVSLNHPHGLVYRIVLAKPE